jgi:HAUS augmin-like complex subunit 6 N-terminus
MPRTCSTGRPLSAQTLSKNLRLLDLDEEFDWPGIDSETFAASSTVQDQQQRCYAAQWLLYKLFALWDPEWTNDILQDLFPPLEPKQASELRLRIYKQLATLKQNGTFANDLVLRRTMFDDCKGTKFEELLTTFSSLVLQRVISRSKEGRSRVGQMAGGSLPLEKEQKAPLTLAYQSGCGNVLKQRKAYEQRWKNLEATLGMKDAELHTASVRLEEAISKRQEKRIPKRTIERLRSTMGKNWIGDIEWASVILQSDLHRPKASFLERTFSEIWSYACKDTLYQVRPQRNDSLLQELEIRVDRQNERLAKWRSIQSDLQARADEAGVESPEAPKTPKKIHGYQESPLHKPAVTVDANNLVDADRGAEGTSRANPVHSRSPSQEDNSLHSMSFESPQTVNLDCYGSRPGASGGQEVSKLWRESSGHEAPLSGRDARAEQIISSVTNAAPTPARLPLTLAERTRMSMARMSPQKRSTARRDVEESVSLGQPFPNATSPDARTPERSSYASLAERTRQSISHAAAGPHANAARKPRASRLSNMYPINQFQMPKKAAQGMIDSPEVSLLEERLDALAVDEESAFKSRPLLAKSPPLSPQPDAVEEDILSV